MTSPAGAVGDITRLSAAEIARHVSAGELSALEVVEACLSRIARVNRRLNALAVPLFEEARAAAAAADAARERGQELGPLHGVPVTIKEMFDVKGTPTTAGLAGRARQKAAADSVLVTRLRRAGAIVLGKTNVPQVGMLAETDNPIYGRTNNPWAADRSPGGSSGGEAALIAAGGSPLGLGSDGGGSIRQPCHCCGIHGLKPTGGRLPFRGHWMVPNWRDHWVQPGPMARRVADLQLALGALADPGPDATEAGSQVPPLGDPSAVAVGSLRVAAYTDDGFFPPAPAIRRAVREATLALRERGAQVEDFRPPDVAEPSRIYFGLFYADGLAAIRECLGGGPCDWRVRRLLLLMDIPNALRPAVKRLFAWTGQRYAEQVIGFLPRRCLSSGEHARLLDEETAYRGRFLAALDAGRFDAIVCPPSGLPALRHGAFNGSVAASYTYLYNLLGLPAGVVAATRVRPGEESDREWSWDPVVRTARAVEAGSAGLPVGVQVVARPWREDVVLAVMAALEDHFGRQPDYPSNPPV
jgi:fatty acid amide hydrolase